jgi:hypothetical protein
MPGQKDFMVGTLLRAEVAPGRSHQIQFRRQRGLYFANDVDMIKRYRSMRHEQRRRKREQRAATQQRAVTVAHKAAPELPPLPQQAYIPRPMSPQPGHPSQPAVTDSGESITLGYGYRAERAGQIVVFVAGSFGAPWYIYRDRNGPYTIHWRGATYRGCEEITPGAADKELRRYRQ